nr:putative reverse transcriptase domain-containing protein [Tanacetum cinerariifolium]
MTLNLGSYTPPPTNLTYEEAPLGYRAARLRWRAEREEILEANMPLRKRLCTAHTGICELGESSAAAAARLREPVRDDLYRFVDTFERGEGSTPAAIEVREPVRDDLYRFVDTFERGEGSTPAAIEVGYGITDTRDDLTSMIYAMIEEKQDDQALKRAQVNRLFKDRRYHAHTARLIEGEARASHTAWTQSMDAIDAAHSEEEIRELRAAHYKLQAHFIQALTALKSCQTQLTAALVRIQILEAARVPAQPEKIAPKRTTRANLATTTTITTNYVINAQLEVLIEQGVAKALATRDANKNTNGDDSHVSGTDKIERYVGGLPDVIHRSVVASRPKTMQEGTFLLTNCYASILFHTGADRSFVSTAFSFQIAITPTTLDHYYDLELADKRIIRLNSILRGCTLNFLNHPLNIDLMPVELGSFDVIIGMDWLAKYHAVIVCAKKIVCIPWVNEILIVHCDISDWGNETRLNINSCAKTQKYIQKGCHVFLAHITTKETEDKSEKNQLEDVPIVRNFPEVCPKDLLGLPLTRKVEFQIDLIPGAAPVARAPYQLASFEMKELSDQLKELSEKGFIRPSSSP